MYVLVWCLESGTSSDKCSEIYPGPAAFSEIETLNIKNFVETLDPVPVLGQWEAPTFKIYIGNFVCVVFLSIKK